MQLYSQCYYLDSGLIMDVRYSEDSVDAETGDPIAAYIDSFDQESWFNPAVHGVCSVEFDFPVDWERSPWFYVPGTGEIVQGGYGRHPLLKALSQELDVDWEDIEDKIESAGGLRAAVDGLDIGRLGRRVKKMYLASQLTLAQVQTMKNVFGHLSSDFD